METQEKQQTEETKKLQAKCPLCGAVREFSADEEGMRVECTECFAPFVLHDNSVSKVVASASGQTGQPVASAENSKAHQVARPLVSVLSQTEQGAEEATVPGPFQYALDFLKNMMSLGRIGILLYFGMCIAIVAIPCTNVLQGVAMEMGVVMGWYQALFWILVLVLAWIVISLSPIGESMDRKANGCVPLEKQEDMDRLMPIFNHIQEQVRRLEPKLQLVDIFISEDEKIPNAFALSRSTICVTRALLYMPLTDRHIEAILAHEFGHIVHKDTDVLKIVMIGNRLCDLYFTIIGFLWKIFRFFATIFVTVIGSLFGFVLGMALSEGGRDGGGAAVGGGTFTGRLSAWLANMLGDLQEWIAHHFLIIWYKVQRIVISTTGREEEYAADMFALNCGYGKELCEALIFLSGGVDDSPSSFLAMLNSSHPATVDRVARLEENGVELGQKQD